jgi:hypothetical protein|tara:strand:+ start:849 stop:1151 length:303 start_codon:yes stop_codon:yes gene_type:complete
MYKIDLTNIDNNKENIINNLNKYSDIYINEDIYDKILDIDKKIDEIRNIVNKNKNLFIITVIYIIFYLLVLIIPLIKYIKINKLSLLLSIIKFILLNRIF